MNVKTVALVTTVLGLVTGAGAAYYSLSWDVRPLPPMSVTPEVVVIGTGAVTGVYYPTGGAICRVVNAAWARAPDKEDARLTYCAAESTDGSLANLAAVRDGILPFAIVQSDWQYHAYNGSMRFIEDGPNPALRSVFSIYKEPFTLIARRDAGIESFADLRGRRINVGPPGSGQRTTMERLLRAFGWTLEDFEAATELGGVAQFKALCAEETDAVMFVTGHPSGLIRDAATACDAVLVSVAGPQIEQLLVESPYYAKALIPGGTYPGNPEPIVSFGVAATLVASNSVSADTVHEVVQAFFAGLDQFKTMHPAFAGLTREAMIRDALTAPAHDGALRYYREQGWR